MATWRHRDIRTVGDAWLTTVDPYGKGSTSVDKGGTIRNGGAVQQSTGSNFQNQNLADGFAPMGVVVYDSSSNNPLNGQDMRLLDKAYSGGDFATMTAGVYVMRKVSTTLAGQSKTTLRSGASQFFTPRRPIHRLETWRTSVLTSWTWAVTDADITVPSAQAPNYPQYTAIYSNQTTNQGQNSTATNPASQDTQDVASRPSATYPGQLVYRDGSFNPALDLYKAKTST